MRPDEGQPTPSAKSSKTAPMDEKGRRESETGGPAPGSYGEPRGPRPPHFTVLPKDEIERRARGGAGEERAAPPEPRHAAGEREVRGFSSGMTTTETFETTGDPQPAVVRRGPGGEILPEDEDGPERPPR